MVLFLIILASISVGALGVLWWASSQPEDDENDKKRQELLNRIDRELDDLLK